MEHLALYRKYRPSSFEDVCGQDHVVTVLRRESEEGRISHAYLFCGPRGTGKTTCAKILAKAVNCESPVEGDPCGKCASCRAIEEETATDVVEMDAASNTGVDYIRDIKDEVSYTPAFLKKKVYIIDEVHMLSIGAFNALLKTLEEPPAHVMFILATTEQHKLPATVVSRCQRFDFRRLPIGAISARLSDIAKNEKISLDLDAAQMIAKQASGGMRDAINLMELCAGGGTKIDVDRVRDALGISGIDLSEKIARAVKDADYSELFSSIDRVTTSSSDLSVFFGELISFWRDMIVMRYSVEDSSYLDLTDAERQNVKCSSELFTPEELLYHSGLLESAVSEMNRLPQIKRYIAETTLLKMSDKRLKSSQESILARVADLEDQIKLIKAGSLPVISADTEEPDRIINKEGPKDHEKDESVPALPLNNEDAKKKVSDTGEFISKVSSSNVSAGQLLENADIIIEGDKKLIVRVKDVFSSNLLKRSDISEVIIQSAVVSGLFDVTPDLEIVFDSKAEKENPFEDFE